MIKSIELINYEGHKHSKIELVPGINVIKGENDQGKSSFSRAIDLVACNTSGDDFISKWCKDKDTSKVIIETTEGDIIERERGKNVNLYKLNEDPLEGFGREVPKKVKEVLNIDSINIQFQEDRAFLLSSNSGQIARFLNQLVDLDIIDTSHANIEKRKREVRNKNDILKNQLSSLENRLLEFSHLDSMEERIQKIERLDRGLKNSVNKQKEIVFLMREIRQERNNLEKYKKITQYKNKIDYLIEILDRWEKLIKEQDEVEDVLHSLRDLKTDRDYYKGIIQYKDRVNYLINLTEEKKKLEKEQFEIEEILLTLNILKDDKKANEKIIKHYDKINKLEINLKGLIEKQKTKNEIDYILSELKYLNKIKTEKRNYIEKCKKRIDEIMPNICPLCDQEIK